jgi:hypothetical protein
MTVFEKALLVPEDPRNQASDGIGHQQGRQLAARQDKVANAENFRCAGLADAIVDTLIMAAQENDLPFLSKFSCMNLIETFSRWIG